MNQYQAVPAKALKIGHGRIPGALFISELYALGQPQGPQRPAESWKAQWNPVWILTGGTGHGVDPHRISYCLCDGLFGFLISSVHSIRICDFTTQNILEAHS